MDNNYFHQKKANTVLLLNLIYLIINNISLKRQSLLILVLAILAAVTGYLLSHISFVGKAGISIMYTEYTFLKSWWKGALIVFIVWMVLLALQSGVAKRASGSTNTLTQIVFFIIAAAGLFLSYSDFHNSLSHKWLGQLFHSGVYLFWIGWMLICLSLMLTKKSVSIEKQP